MIEKHLRSFGVTLNPKHEYTFEPDLLVEMLDNDYNWERHVLAALQNACLTNDEFLYDYCIDLIHWITRQLTMTMMSTTSCGQEELDLQACR